MVAGEGRVEGVVVGAIIASAVRQIDDSGCDEWCRNVLRLSLRNRSGPAAMDSLYGHGHQTWRKVWLGW